MRLSAGENVANVHESNQVCNNPSPKSASEMPVTAGAKRSAKRPYSCFELPELMYGSHVHDRAGTGFDGGGTGPSLWRNAMRFLVIGAGLVLLVLGVLWALQGVGLVGGSFMTNNTKWIYIGLITVLAGLGLLAASRRFG